MVYIIMNVRELIVLRIMAKVNLVKLDMKHLIPFELENETND